MNRHSEQVIAKAEATRAELVKECHSLIVKLAYKRSCIKLLTLARNYLEMLAEYKYCRRQRGQG
jgi:hypothetical protein